MLLKDKRVWIIAIIFAVCIVYLMPTILNWEPRWWPAQKINLGLDLQGGMHVVLTADVDKAIQDEMIRHVDTIKNVFKDRSLSYKDVRYDQTKKALIVEFNDADSLNKGETYLRDNWKDFDISGGGELTLALTMNKEFVTYVRQNALKQARETISNRVDEFNVREPEIYVQGTDQIVVRLPGIVDPSRALKLIGRTAVLEFKMVNDKAGRAPTREQLLQPYGGVEPAGYKVYESRGKTGGESGFYLLRETAELSGAYLVDARTGYDQYQQPAVDFSFNNEGAQKFATITGANIGKQLAIVLDNVVYSAPVIQSRIAANGQITGSFTREEALDLAIVLRAGALPVPVRLDENRTVGATLGSDSIRSGLLSFVVGLVAVVLFMGIYYR